MKGSMELGKSLERPAVSHQAELKANLPCVILEN